MIRQMRYSFGPALGKRTGPRTQKNVGVKADLSDGAMRPQSPHRWLWHGFGELLQGCFAPRAGKWQRAGNPLAIHLDGHFFLTRARHRPFATGSIALDRMPETVFQKTFGNISQHDIRNLTITR